MKKKAIFLMVLLTAAMQPMQAARRTPSQVGAPAKSTEADMKQLFKAIKSADDQKVKELLDKSADLINEHSGKFTPLGKAYHELELNKQNSSLDKAERNARSRKLNKIIKQLKEGGATEVHYDNSGSSKKAPVKAKAA